MAVEPMRLPLVEGGMRLAERGHVARGERSVGPLEGRERGGC